MKQKTFRTRRLVLRPYRASDYAAWKRWGEGVLPPKNPFDWSPSRGHRWNRAEFAKLLKKHGANARADRQHVWVVFERRSGAVLGYVDVATLHRGPLQKGNLGYRLDNRYWGKGFGREMLQRMIPVVLRELRLQRLEAVIDLDNRASRALATAVGLKREGVRKNYYYQNKRWDDQVVYIATREMYRLPRLHP